MATSSKLYELIKSLSSAEKRYFKIQSSIFLESNSIYVQIFDLIVKQGTYNETKIKRKLRGYRGIKQFCTIKESLYQRILEGLESYHRNKYIANQITQLLYHSQLLFKRGLFMQSKKLLERAKIKVLNQEKYEWMPSILMQERKLYYRKVFGEANEAKLNEIRNEEQQTLDKLETLF
ncbi:MAG: hypothetical protein GY810_27150 [Aureispira sp.]|nr:hypothetical protein [Aureispira sp.]